MKVGGGKVANNNIPATCSYFPLAIDDILLEDCRVTGPCGSVDGVQTYRNYYRQKEKTLKRKMRSSKEECSFEKFLKDGDRSDPNLQIIVWHCG